MSSILKHFGILVSAILFTLMCTEGAQSHANTATEDLSDADMMSFVPVRALFNFPISETRNAEHVSTEEADSDLYRPLTTAKRSSVSWLLAAAIRMCTEHPEQCLRQRRLRENYQKIKKADAAPSRFAASAIQFPWQRR